MKKILMVIDDDDDDRFLFVEAVSKINPAFECIEAKTALEALDHLNMSEKIPDFIFLDMNMPHIDGKETLRNLKNNGKLKFIPVVIYSSSVYPPDRDETEKLGAIHYLVKPDSFTELHHEIEAVLKMT